MKTTSITVQHNYRTSNDDPYARTTIIHNIDLEEGETKQEATVRAIKEMDEIFRLTYPYMEEHLNFYVVRQLKEQFPIITQDKINTTLRHEDGSYTSIVNKSVNLGTSEKINKGTIEWKYPVATEETILKEMGSYKLGASAFKTVYALQVKDNPKLKKAFDEKLKELESKKQSV